MGHISADELRYAFLLDLIYVYINKDAISEMIKNNVYELRCITQYIVFGNISVHIICYFFNFVSFLTKKHCAFCALC